MSLRYSAVEGKKHNSQYHGQLVASGLERKLTLGTGLNQDTQVSLPLVEGLGTLPQTTGKTVVDESVLSKSSNSDQPSPCSTSQPNPKPKTHLENLLKSILDAHSSLGGSGDLDILNNLLGGTGSSVRTSVRHFCLKVKLVFFRAANKRSGSVSLCRSAGSVESREVRRTCFRVEG